MDLALTADQRAIQEAFTDVFTREAKTTHGSAAVETGFDTALWTLVAELGAVGIAVPDDAGGAGAGLLELVLVAEQAGRRIAGVPLVEAAVGARVLAATGGAPLLLDDALAGRRLAVFAPRPAVDGVATVVPGGAVADAVVALDRDQLVAVEGPPGEGIADLGMMAIADRDLAGDGVTRTVLAEGDKAREHWARAHDDWRIGTAALLNGLAAEAVAIGVRYALERVQFGVPIAAFQALQQPLADIQTAVEGGELLAREAAWCRDRGLEECARLAPMAYAHASRTAERAAATSLHVHGGYGYTLEYDIQYYLRRAKALSLADGDPELAWEAIGATAVAQEA
jgi:alkylation response protein AidB-like acyl-CoA dehydrogenase